MNIIIRNSSYKNLQNKSMVIFDCISKNYRKKLCKSLIEQVEIFIPPSGSFNNQDLRRYLELDFLFFWFRPLGIWNILDRK